MLGPELCSIMERFGPNILFSFIYLSFDFIFLLDDEEAHDIAVT